MWASTAIASNRQMTHQLTAEIGTPGLRELMSSLKTCTRLRRLGSADRLDDG